MTYFLLKKLFTSSGTIIDSTKVYAPDFGDLTILIALVNLFDPVCNDATDFFAMIQLFNFFMNRHAFKNRIEFLNFHTVGCILFVFGRNVP